MAKKYAIFFLCALSLVVFGSTLFAKSKGIEPLFYVPQEIVVKFKKEFSSPFVKAHLHQITGAKVIQQFDSFPELQHVQLKKENFEKILNFYKNHPSVEYAEPNRIYFINDHSFEIPNDAKFPEQWALHNTGQKMPNDGEGIPGADIETLEAWQITRGSKNVVVAILDTGIDSSHEDLSENMWLNINEIPNNQIDDDKNGYIDDIRGWDFANNDNDPMDDHGHGSHVAGTIGAIGNNEKGVMGVSPHVSLMPIKFFDSSGSGKLTDAVLAVEYAVKNGAHILNNSWGGGGYSEALSDAIKLTYEKNILFVAASGNDHQNNDAYDHYPSNYPFPNVLAVAATNNKDELASFSNYGFKNVHVSGPGSDILSTIPENKYDFMSGTSMATPHVVGVSALLLSQENLTPLEIKTRLIETSDEVLSVRRKIAAKGRVNAYNALKNVIPPKKEPKDPGSWIHVPLKISTEHEYKENTKEHWMIQKTDATFIKVHFSIFDTEEGYDFVKITDGKGELIDQLDGGMGDIWSFMVTGDTMHIYFEADGSLQKYGFDIDEYAYSTQ